MNINIFTRTINKNTDAHTYIDLNLIFPTLVICLSLLVFSLFIKINQLLFLCCCFLPKEGTALIPVLILIDRRKRISIVPFHLLLKTILIVIYDIFSEIHGLFLFRDHVVFVIVKYVFK